MKDYVAGHCTKCHGTKTINDGRCPQCKGTGLLEKTDRNRLTAAMALANAYEPGFRGTTNVQGRIDHNVRVITAVPRPKYIENKPQKLLDKGKDKGYNSVEEVIEGEVINE